MKTLFDCRVSKQTTRSVPSWLKNNSARLRQHAPSARSSWLSQSVYQTVNMSFACRASMKFKCMQSRINLALQRALMSKWSPISKNAEPTLFTGRDVLCARKSIQIYLIDVKMVEERIKTAVEWTMLRRLKQESFAELNFLDPSWSSDRTRQRVTGVVYPGLSRLPALFHHNVP